MLQKENFPFYDISALVSIFQYLTDLAGVALGGGDAGLTQADHAVTFPLPLHVSGPAVTRARAGQGLVSGQLIICQYSHAQPGLA